MKTALVILSRNAVRRGVWSEVLDAVDRQEFRADERIVYDSGSDDATVAVAAAHDWKIVPVRREEFDHGATRDRIVRELFGRNFEAVVFLSQDAVLASPDALGRLVNYLRSNDISGCYGRQIDTRGHSLEAWQRERCYPETSAIKTAADVPRLKLLTPFFSNAFAAWKLAAVIELGGFTRTGFGEDMLLAAKTIESGGAVGYCADAAVIHEHPETLRGLFLRGRAVGDFHRRHPELLRHFGSPGRPPLGKKFLPLLPQFLAKSLGYVWGRHRERLTPWLIFVVLWLFLLPAIVMFDYPQADVATRYAPMAEAFASGDWHFAFHPRIPPLLPVCAGVIVRVCSCDGALACRLAGALFLSFGLFPLYWGVRRMYGSRVAAAAAMLYAGCAWLFRFGYYGLREPLCVFAVLMLFMAAVRMRMRSSSKRWYLVFAAAETMLLLSRGDLALFVLATLTMLLVWDLYRHRQPLRTVAVVALMLMLLLPVLLYNYRMIGYPVPEVRHGVVMSRLCRRFGWLKVLENPHPQLVLDIGGVAEDEE